MPLQYFPAIIDRSADGFGVSFPDFPGCIAAGDTIQAAAINAEAALALHLEGMIGDKDPIPAPSSLDDIEPIEGGDDVAHILVRAELPGRVTRVLLSMDEGVVAAVDAVASNRSAFIAEAIRERLARLAQSPFYTVKPRQVYVMLAKGNRWRVCPHWTEQRGGRAVPASTVLPDRFDSSAAAVLFASRLYDVPESKVIVRETSAL